MTTAEGDGQSNLPLSIVSQSGMSFHFLSTLQLCMMHCSHVYHHRSCSLFFTDLLANPNSVVQILPVSFRNNSGVPETINVVITVPQNSVSKSSDSTMTPVLQPTARPALSK